MQDVLSGDGLRANAGFSEGDVFRQVGVKMVADHEHVEVLIQRIHREGAGGVGRRRQHVRLAANLQDVRGVAAAGTLGVEGVDGAAAKGRDRVFDEPRLVECVGVNGYLHVVFFRHAQTAIDGGRGRAPILVQLQAQSPGFDLFAQRLRQRAVALAKETHVNRVFLGRLQHPVDVPRPRRARRSVGAGGGAGTPSQHRGDAGGDGFRDLLRADQVHVGVDAPRGHDHPLAGNDFRVRPYHEPRVNISHQGRIAGLADGVNIAVLDTDIGFHHAPVIDNQRVGDQQIRRLVRLGLGRLPHAIAQDLAAPELDLVAVGGEVVFHLDKQFGVGQPHAVAGGRAVHLRIGPPLDG